MGSIAIPSGGNKEMTSSGYIGQSGKTISNRTVGSILSICFTSSWGYQPSVSGATLIGSILPNSVGSGSYMPIMLLRVTNPTVTLSSTGSTTVNNIVGYSEIVLE